MMMNACFSDAMLRQYIDQLFYRYDYNRTGTLNIFELHNYLNELFMMSGIPRNVTYNEAYNLLMQMDSNRDGQLNKFELFNLFMMMHQPGFRPLPYSFGGYSYRGPGGYGIGGISPIGGIGGYGGVYRAPTTTITTVSSPVVGNVYTRPLSPIGGIGYGGIGGIGIGAPVGYGIGVGGIDASWSSNWSGWA